MWFDEQTAVMVGAISGASVGILGAVLGTMAGLFARKGRYKNVTLGMAKILIFIGFIELAAGLAALFMEQPYSVWYPFVIVGLILCSVVIPSYFTIKNIYNKVKVQKPTSGTY